MLITLFRYQNFETPQLARTLSAMPPVEKPSQDLYDYVLIGGGSGGVASAVGAHSKYDVHVGKLTLPL